MVKISGVVITFNEEQNIARCLDSISKVVDEIVVIDSFSTDKTKTICAEKGVRFIEHKFESHISQKNFAIEQAQHDIILSLDADEYLSKDLEESILQVKANWSHTAYKMNRLSMYGDKWVKHGSWYPERKLRLWDRRVGKWGGYNPHDLVVLSNGIKPIRLKGDLLHRSYRNSYETLQKIQSYSTIYAHDRKGKVKSTVFKIIIHSSFAFFKSYFLKLGFLDGYEGLVVAVSCFNHTFYKYAKVKEGYIKN